MPDTTVFDELNVAEYLFLRDVSEPRDNSLRIIVEEAVANPSMLLNPTHSRVSRSLQTCLKGSKQIEYVEGCKVFELYWERYVAYLITEEMVGSCAVGKYGDEVFAGRLLREYSRSHFLDHIARDTGGHFETVHHYKLICLNHLIDVAAYVPPQVSVIDPPSETV